MFLLHKNKFVLLALCFCSFYFGTKAQNIEVVFSSIRSSQGQIVLKIFNTENSYEDDKPNKQFIFKKKNIVNGEMKVSFTLEPGSYGFALTDDENNDSEMNYTFIGMPKEGFAFSNYYLTGLFKPKFEVFKLTVNKDQKQKVQMKMKYL